VAVEACQGVKKDILTNTWKVISSRKPPGNGLCILKNFPSSDGALLGRFLLVK
jgi:hypothetical protein